jgi:ABC-type dipeptide/oligopeptide/nickel transport system permease component
MVVSTAGPHLWRAATGHVGRHARAGIRRARRAAVAGLLATSSIVVASIVGLTARIISATRQYSVVDYLVMGVALFGVSIPVFNSGSC